MGMMDYCLLVIIKARAAATHLGVGTPESTSIVLSFIVLIVLKMELKSRSRSRAVRATGLKSFTVGTGDFKACGTVRERS